MGMDRQGQEAGPPGEAEAERRPQDQRKDAAVRHSRRQDRSPALPIILMAAVAVPAFSVLAQPLDRPAPNQGALPPRFVKVQKRVDDGQGLSVSSRIFPIDMRQPTGFGDVFRIQGSAPYAAALGVANPLGGDLFARIDGAVTAVFPQSVY